MQLPKGCVLIGPDRRRPTKVKRISVYDRVRPLIDLRIREKRTFADLAERAESGRGAGGRRRRGWLARRLATRRCAGRIGRLVLRVVRVDQARAASHHTCSVLVHPVNTRLARRVSGNLHIGGMTNVRCSAAVNIGGFDVQRRLARGQQF